MVQLVLGTGGDKLHERTVVGVRLLRVAAPLAQLGPLQRQAFGLVIGPLRLLPTVLMVVIPLHRKVPTHALPVEPGPEKRRRGVGLVGRHPPALVYHL